MPEYISLSTDLLREIIRFIQVNFKDTAEFACEVSDESIQGQWLKNGKPVNASEKIKIVQVRLQLAISIIFYLPQLLNLLSKRFTG